MIKHRKGFTLIELLVVITIIAILAAILFPVFLMARAKARSVGCISNMKQFGSLFAMYQGDWDQRFPYTSYPTGNQQQLYGGMPIVGAGNMVAAGTNWRSRIDELWTSKLANYTGYPLIYNGQPQGVLRCKAAERSWQVFPPWFGGGGANWRDHTGYGYNFLFLGLPWRAQDAANPFRPANMGGFSQGSPRLTYLKSPDNTVLLVENATLWAYPPYTSAGAGWMSGNMLVRPRHSRTDTNVLWCDNSVSSIDARDLIRAGAQFGDARTEQQGRAMNNDLWGID